MVASNSRILELKMGPEVLTYKDVHIWQVNPTFLDICPPILSEEELIKAHNFKFEKDRAQYIRSHVALRLILSKYTKTTPGELIFSHNKHGKPFLEGKQIYFNLSHSEDLSLIAVSLISRIGIDVEKVREVPNFMQIAKLFFADEESKNLEVLPEKSRASAFFKTWTCKEAFTKAVGEGLSLDLRSFSIQFAPKAQIQFLNNMQKHLNSLNWSILELILSEGYMGALAVEEKNPRYFYYQLL